MINKQPLGDLWKLVDFDQYSQNYRKAFMADFSYISSDEIRTVFKNFVWNNYITRNRALSSLKNEILVFKKFAEFAEKNDIDNFRKITNAEVTGFVSFLKTKISKATGKSYSYAYQKNCLDALKAIIYWCQIHYPDSVPDIEIFTGNEYRGVNERLKIEYIPDEIMEKINSAIKTEPDPYVKCGLQILKMTGMRLGDLLKLKTDCVQDHPISGSTLNWYQYKNRREHPPLPIPRQCAEAIYSLLAKTKEIRLLAKNEIKDLLFIRRDNDLGDVVYVTSHIFNKWLNRFAQDNNILGQDGRIYRLTSHKFRNPNLNKIQTFR